MLYEAMGNVIRPEDTRGYSAHSLTSGSTLKKWWTIIRKNKRELKEIDEEWSRHHDFWSLEELSAKLRERQDQREVGK